MARQFDITHIPIIIIYVLIITFKIQNKKARMNWIQIVYIISNNFQYKLITYLPAEWDQTETQNNS